MLFSILFHHGFKIGITMIFIIKFKQITVDDSTCLTSQPLSFIQSFDKLIDISSAKIVDNSVPGYFHEIYLFKD